MEESIEVQIKEENISDDTQAPNIDQEDEEGNNDEEKLADDAQAPEGEEDNNQEDNGDIDDEEEDEEEEDDVKVTIEDTAPEYNLRAKQRQPQQPKPAAVDLDAGQAILDVDLSTLEDKPWRKPGADISDYFNYGFDEDTWKLYCEKQKKMKQVVGELTTSETFKIPVVPANEHPKYAAAPMKIPTIVSNEPRFNWGPQILEPESDERERERERDRERERHRDREKTRDRDKEREREKEKEREREKERDRDKERDREKTRDREKNRDRDKNREREKTRDRERGHRDSGTKKRERDRSRERERDKKRKRSR